MGTGSTVTTPTASAGLIPSLSDAQAEALMYPDGINLRKEAQKIDIKQFDPNNVNHVSTMMAVMRPIPGLKE